MFFLSKFMTEFPGFHPHPNKKQEKNSTIFLRKENRKHEKTHKTLAWIETSSAPQVKFPRFAGWVWPLDFVGCSFRCFIDFIEAIYTTTPPETGNTLKGAPVDAKVPISAEKNNKTNESRSQGVTNGHSIWHQAKITQTIHTIFWGNIPQIFHRFAWCFWSLKKLGAWNHDPSKNRSQRFSPKPLELLPWLLSLSFPTSCCGEGDHSGGKGTGAFARPQCGTKCFASLPTTWVIFKRIWYYRKSCGNMGIFKSIPETNLVGGFLPPPLKNMLIKLDHFPKDRGEDKKKICDWNHRQKSLCFLLRLTLAGTVDLSRLTQLVQQWDFFRLFLKYVQF